METWEEGEPECPLLGLSMPTRAQWGRGEEVEQPCPLCKARQGMPQWGLGPSRPTGIKKQKLKLLPG